MASNGELIVDRFLQKLVIDTKNSLAAKEKAKAARHGTPWNGNSRLWGQIKAKRVVKGGNTAYQLVMPDYSYWVDKGRNSGNVARRADIKNWIKRKGLNPVAMVMGFRQKAREDKGTKSRGKPYKKPTFAKATSQVEYIVRRKVAAEGYEGNSFYTSVIKDGRVEKLKKEYTEAVRKDLMIEINNIMK